MCMFICKLIFHCWGVHAIARTPQPVLSEQNYSQLVEEISGIVADLCLTEN